MFDVEVIKASVEPPNKDIHQCLEGNDEDISYDNPVQKSESECEEQQDLNEPLEGVSSSSARPIAKGLKTAEGCGFIKGCCNSPSWASRSVNNFIRSLVRRLISLMP